MNKHQVKSLTILGSGTSTGIPMLGCNCSVCKSNDLKNKRLRTSFLITTVDQKNIIVDTGPDLRTQLLNNKITNIDSAIITHSHADHVHGIDDLRPFCFGPPKRSIPIYTNELTAKDLKKRFSYIFDETYHQNRPILGGGIPKLHLENVTTDFSANNIDGVDFHFCELPHGHTKSLMLYFSKIAIAIDCQEIPEQTIKYLKNKSLELLIIDCVKEGQHKTHLTLDQTLHYIEEIKPKRAILVHMGHQLDHFELDRKVKEKIGPHVAPGHDGQIISF